MKLLLAEDEKELSNALVAVLKANNYIVDAVYDGADAYDWAVTDDYDGIILDIMMPKRNGIDVLAQLRKDGIKTPVLLLTAKSEVEDRVLGLDTGADDYLTKPFAMKELLARIRVMTRRTASYAPDTLDVDGMKLNRGNCMLEYNGGEVQLVNKEYQMLEMLMSNPGQVISPDLFMDKIWGYDSEAEQNVVWVYISYLRKKLTSIGSQVKIRAARGLGYSLEKDNA